MSLGSSRVRGQDERADDRANGHPQHRDAGPQPLYHQCPQDGSRDTSVSRHRQRATGCGLGEADVLSGQHRWKQQDDHVVDHEAEEERGAERDSVSHGGQTEQVGDRRRFDGVAAVAAAASTYSTSGGMSWRMRRIVLVSSAIALAALPDIEVTQAEPSTARVPERSGLRRRVNSMRHP